MNTTGQSDNQVFMFVIITSWARPICAQICETFARISNNAFATSPDIKTTLFEDRTIPKGSALLCVTAQMVYYGHFEP